MPMSHQDEGDVRIGDYRKELGAPVGRHGYDVQPSGRQRLGLAGDDRRSTIDLPQKFGNVIGDDIDDMKLERLRSGKARCAADRFGCPVRVAAIKLRKTTDVGDCIIDGLSGFNIPRLVGALLGRLPVRVGAGKHG
jgi:hypothetical protein